MFTETIKLEKLRQKIEDVEYEAGSQSDYIDLGKPSPAQAKQARENIEKLSNQSRALKEELRQLITDVRAQQPQAFDEWINLHIEILQKIVDENTTDAKARTRVHVAKETIQNWEKVRAGEQEYVNINWYFLKDYKSDVRKLIRGGTGKVWWQVWR
jgi:hypothetical protein